MRLERLGKGLAAHSGEMVVAHLGMVLAVEASAYQSSDAVLESLVTASGMRMMSMHRQANHVQVSEERPWLRQARPGVAS
jgi:hypothetical protein